MENKIKCAVPLLGARVAPRPMFSSSTLVADIIEREVISKKTVCTENLDEYQWLYLLIDLEVDVIVCGGISREIIKLFGDYGIRVICNVAGEAEEVIKVLAEGGLHPWYGYGYRDARAHPTDIGSLDPAPLSESISSDPGPCSCRERRRLWDESQKAYFEREPVDEDMLSLALLSFLPVCPLRQLGKTFKERGYRRVGIIYCSALSELAVSLINELLSELDVVPMVCPMNCKSFPEMNSKPGLASCCPGDQAGTIKKEDCDVCVILGMCDAFYHVFSRLAQTPSLLVVPTSMEQLNKAKASELG